MKVFLIILLMKSFLIILALLLAVILQTTLLPFLSFKGITPNLVLVLILFWVISKSFKEIWLMVILAGLFLDLFSGLPFGLISLSLVGTAYLIDWFNKNVFSGDKFWIVVALIALGSLFYNLILVGLSGLFILVNISQIALYSGIFSLDYLTALFLVIAYNLVIFIFFYGVKKIFYQK
jgi:rod shape-determining protein MreD